MPCLCDGFTWKTNNVKVEARVSHQTEASNFCPTFELAYKYPTCSGVHAGLYVGSHNGRRLCSSSLKSNTNSFTGSKQQMLELEDSFVDGSLEIPGQGSEEPSNADDQNTEFVENGP